MKNFLDFQVDHMTLLVDPAMYRVAYLAFRVVFGVRPEDLLYEKRRPAAGGREEVSMTFAARIGGRDGAPEAPALRDTIIAVVQPSEPPTERSHVREMLAAHSAAAHWQHIALRTPDLLAFHEHALARGVNFITPILRDADEDLIQVFSGEWFFPGSPASAVFFEFVQREPNQALLKKLEERNRESWFRDKTFLGLYQEKENEYRSGKVKPFLDEDLFRRLEALVQGKQVWQISEDDVARAEKVMLEYGGRRAQPQAGSTPR